MATIAPVFSGVTSNDPPRRPRALDEQADRRVLHDRLGRARSRRRRKGERAERELAFGCELERRPARQDDAQRRAALGKPCHLRGDGDDLLQVVQEQQRLPVADHGDDAVEERSPLCLLDVEGACESGHEGRRLERIGEGDEGDGIGELGREDACQLEQDARLPDPARSGDRDEPMRPHEAGERSHLVRATDQRRRGRGNVARQARKALALALERPRIRHHESIGRDGVELEGAPHVLEPEPAQRDEHDIGLVPDLLEDRVRHEDGTALRERLDSRCDVDCVAGQTLRLDDDLARVHADAGQDLVRRELLLGRHRRLHRGERAREHAHAPVPEPLHDRPSERLMVAFQGVPVALPPLERELLVRLEQRGVPDHVREHHRDEAAIESEGHAAILSGPRLGCQERLRRSVSQSGGERCPYRHVEPTAVAPCRPPT